jgi:hypothetical protein
MKTTLCFLGWAHFSIFPRLAHIGQQPTYDTTVAHPRRIPVPCFRKTRCPPLSCLGWCHGRAPFSPPRAATISPPPLAPPDLASSLCRTPPPSNPHYAALKRGRCIAFAPFPLFLFLVGRRHPYAFPSMPPVRVPPPPTPPL